MNCLQRSWLMAQDKKIGIRETNSTAAFKNPAAQLDYIAYAASGKKTVSVSTHKTFSTHATL